MNARRQYLGALIDRLLIQRKRVHIFHGAAILIVAFAYVIRHSLPMPNPGVRGGGWVSIVAAIVTWWPILVSWIATRTANESTRSFQMWMAMFVLINVAIALINITAVPSWAGEHPWRLSVVHLVALLLTVPLAIETTRKDAGGAPVA